MNFPNGLAPNAQNDTDFSLLEKITQLLYNLEQSGGGGGGPTLSTGILPYTYLIKQNDAGTVYTAYDQTGAVVTSNSTPDIVPILNTLLAALVSGGKGGKIFIKAGSYFATDASGWQTDANDGLGPGAARYLIGVPVVSAANQFMPIEIEGEGVGAWGEIYTRFSLGGATALNTAGTQIKCVLSTGVLPSGNCSIFRVLAQPTADGHFNKINFVKLAVGRIRFTAGTNVLSNASYWWNINAYYASGFSVTGGLICDVQMVNTSESNSSSGSFGVGGVGSTGLIMPNGGNQGACSIDMLHCCSFNIGAHLFDHAEVGYFLSQNNQVGVKLECGTDHIIVLRHYVPQECDHLFNIGSPSRTCFDVMIDAEPPNDLGAPQGRNYISMFQNPNDGIITGNITINMGTSGYLVWGGNGNTLGFGTLPTNAGCSYTMNFIGNYGFTVNGTSGSFRWAHLEMGSNYKKAIVQLNGYNQTGAADVITFLVPFLSTPVLTQPVGFGATVSTTALTLPTSVGATTGVIFIEGY